MAFELLGKAVRRFRLPVVDYINAPIIIVPVQEGDVKSRYFDVTLYDDRGDVNLSKYAKATLNGTTPSGVVLTSNQCEISPDGKNVIVQFSGGFTDSPGRVACDITFVNQGATEQLTSQTFYVIVSPSQSGKIITENVEDYNQLLSLLHEVSGVETQIEEAESGRVAAEQARVTAESKRASAENTRESNEATRKSNENTRESNEETRKSSESTRVTSEAARVKAEEARASAETKRDTAEKQRNTAESERSTAESARASAEQTRATEFATAKENCETATERANTAADTVQEILDALPCDTEIERDGQVEDVVVLRFVELKGE